MVPHNINDKNTLLLLNSAIRELAIKGLRDIFKTNHENINIDFDDVEIRESLRLVLTGAYSTPVFDMQLNLFYESFPWGSYNYIVNMDLEYIDEFFVVY